MARKKKRPAGRPAAQPPASGDSPALSPEEQAARRDQQKREWAAQKSKQVRAQRSAAPFVWGGLGAASLAAVVVLGVVLFAGGGGDGSSSPTPAPTVDPRVAGQTPAQTLQITAADDGQEVNVRYDKSTLNAIAGQVFQIDVKNTGSVHHNLQIDGLDHQYDTLDDWFTEPYAIEAGQTGKVIVKLDKAGTYQFHCSFHPNEQKGVLIIS